MTTLIVKYMKLRIVTPNQCSVYISKHCDSNDNTNSTSLYTNSELRVSVQCTSTNTATLMTTLIVKYLQLGIVASSQCSVYINKHCNSNDNTNSELRVSVQCTSTNTTTLMTTLTVRVSTLIVKYLQLGIVASSQCSVYINKHCDSNDNTNSELRVSVQCTSANTATLMTTLTVRVSTLIVKYLQLGIVASSQCSVYINKHYDSNDNTNSEVSAVGIVASMYINKHYDSNDNTNSTSLYTNSEVSAVGNCSFESVFSLGIVAPSQCSVYISKHCDSNDNTNSTSLYTNSEVSAVGNCSFESVFSVHQQTLRL
ncbi:hypothetical protein J6590_091969 [Homalodisca vitripennis]|nr:hypothetical protein J6590_091969 [Homalodisca vitripennis]